MEGVYGGEKNNPYSRLSTCINKEWRLDKNKDKEDKDYPYSLWVGIGYWDDLTKEFVKRIMELKGE